MDLERGWVWLFDVGTFHVLSVAPRTGIGSIYKHVYNNYDKKRIFLPYFCLLHDVELS